MRLYRTSASFADVNAAIKQEAMARLRGIPGLQRYSTAKLEDGRIVTISAFDSEKSAKASVALAKELRQQAGSKLAKVRAGDPEVIEATILPVHQK